MSHVLRKLQARGDALESDRELWVSRANAIYDGCHAKQSGLIDSAKAGYKYLSVRCPRRAGKSFGMTSLALWWGEMFPESRILIISLTLKSTKENYWSGAPGGLFKQSTAYGLGLKYNNTDYTWKHQNGSRGALAGAETVADIERIRGAKAEADLIIVDECKSFAPEHLSDLIRDVLQPGLMTRDGIMVLGGTPGSIPMGTFFQATAQQARTDDGRPTCIPLGEESGTAYESMTEDERRELWRLHTWTIQDNTGAPRQWVRAVADKKRAGWEDTHPVWRREYLGEWVTDVTDLVYAWATYRNDTDFVTWLPARTKENPSGLDVSKGPWRFILGLDLGFEDDSAFVLAAYSETLKELRHVYDFKAPEMTLDDFFEEIFTVIEKYGRPDAIIADTAGGGSKMLIETLNQRYGLGIEPAKKPDKQDHIELVNSDFARGRIKIIPGSDLAHELAGLQWDLSKDSKLLLARTGRLREDPACPNHLCDAFLYLYRYSHHFWSEGTAPKVVQGSEVWWAEMEAKQLERALARRNKTGLDPHGTKDWVERRGKWS